MLLKSYVAFGLSVLQLCLSQSPVYVIDRVQIDLRDASGGSVMTTFELTDGSSPITQTENFCALYLLGSEHCSLLQSRASEMYRLYQEEQAETETGGATASATASATATATDGVIATVPVVLLSPLGVSRGADFSLLASVDPTAQGK